MFFIKMSLLLLTTLFFKSASATDCAVDLKEMMLMTIPSKAKLSPSLKEVFSFYYRGKDAIEIIEMTHVQNETTILVNYLQAQKVNRTHRMVLWVADENQTSMEMERIFVSHDLSIEAHNTEMDHRLPEHEFKILKMSPRQYEALVSKRETKLNESHYDLSRRFSLIIQTTDMPFPFRQNIQDFVNEHLADKTLVFFTQMSKKMKPTVQEVDPRHQNDQTLLKLQMIAYYLRLKTLPKLNRDIQIHDQRFVGLLAKASEDIPLEKTQRVEAEALIMGLKRLNIPASAIEAQLESIAMELGLNQEERRIVQKLARSLKVFLTFSSTETLSQWGIDIDGLIYRIRMFEELENNLISEDNYRLIEARPIKRFFMQSRRRGQIKFEIELLNSFFSIQVGSESSLIKKLIGYLKDD